MMVGYESWLPFYTTCIFFQNQCSTFDLVDLVHFSKGDFLEWEILLEIFFYDCQMPTKAKRAARDCCRQKSHWGTCTFRNFPLIQSDLKFIVCVYNSICIADSLILEIADSIEFKCQVVVLRIVSFIIWIVWDDKINLHFMADMLPYSHLRQINFPGDYQKA